jgi:hypothetical protein
LGDRRNDGENNCISGDGTGQMAQPWMFMMMIMMKIKTFRTKTVDSDQTALLYKQRLYTQFVQGLEAIKLDEHTVTGGRILKICTEFLTSFLLTLNSNCDCSLDYTKVIQ